MQLLLGKIDGPEVAATTMASLRGIALQNRLKVTGRNPTDLIKHPEMGVLDIVGRVDPSAACYDDHQ